MSVVHTQLLPGDKELLGTTAFGELATISRSTGALRLITTGNASDTDHGVFGRALRGNNPRYLSTGYLVYASGSSLMAVPFDPKRARATGKPTPVVTAIRSEGGPGEAQFALSDEGTLVYVPGLDGSLGRLVWSNERGTLGDTLPLPRSHLLWFRLSRDGRKLAVVDRLPNSTAETRIVDLTRRGVEERVRANGEFGVTSWSADARWLYTSSQPVFTAWPFAGKGPEGKPPLQFGDEGAGLLTVVAAHPAAEFVAGGYDSGELQLGDIKTRRSVVLKMADGSAITCLAWSPDGFHLAAGNENGDLLVIDLRR